MMVAIRRADIPYLTVGDRHLGSKLPWRLWRVFVVVDYLFVQVDPHLGAALVNELFGGTRSFERCCVLTSAHRPDVLLEVKVALLLWPCWKR